MPFHVGGRRVNILPFHCNLYAMSMSTDVSQVGVALFPSFLYSLMLYNRRLTNTEFTSALLSGLGSASHRVTEFGMSIEYVESHFGISPSATSGTGQPSSKLLLLCK